MNDKNYNPIDYANIADNDTIIDTAIKSALNSIVNTCDICKVVSVTDNRCDVELLQGGKIIDVPVLAPAFNKWTFSYPVKKDDTGLLIYTKYESDEYFTNGTFSCDELAIFSKNNALFIPLALFNQPEITDDIIITNEKINLTINADNEVLFTCEKDSGTLTINFNKDNEVSIDNEKANILIDKDGGLSFENEKGTLSLDKEGVLTISNDGGQISMDAQGNITIKGSKAVIDADNIELGQGATESLVLGTTFLSQMNQIITMIKTHTHTCAAPGKDSSPSTSLTTGLNPLQNNILSQVSKTK